MVREAFVLVLGIALAGCAIPINEQHPSVQKAHPSLDNSDGARRGEARATAAADLACEHVEMVLTLERRYANTAAPRYVIEGCGKRALYAETCEDYPRCRYLLLSVLPLPSAPASAPSPAAPVTP
jgi:hypothetical protein